MKRHNFSAHRTIITRLIFTALCALMCAEDIQELPTIYYTIPAASAEDTAVLFFNKEAVEETKAPTLDAFISEAGANVKTSGTAGSAASVYMRGFSGTSIKVFVDGIYANNVQTGLFDFSSLPMSDIESIRIIPGAFNADPGASPSVGGSIYITTLRQKTGWELKTAAESTSYTASFADTNKADVLFSLNRATSFFSVQCSYISAKNEFPFTLEDGTTKTRLNNNYSSGAASLKYIQYFGDGYSFSVSNAFTSGDRMVSGAETAAADHYAQQKDLINRNNFTLKMMSLPFGGITLSAGSDFSKQTYTSAAEDSTHYLETIPITATYRPVINEWFAVNCGGNFTPSFIDSTDLDIDFYYSSFLKAVPTFTLKRIIIELPIQTEFTSTGFSFIPQGSVTYSLHKWNIALSVSSMNQQPTLNQLYWNDSQYAAGNPNLIPENGAGSELNVSYTSTNHTSKISIFGTYYTNKIQWNPDNSDEGKWKPQNIGKAALFGGAINSRFSILSLHFLFNYEYVLSYLLSDYTFADNKRIMYTPEHTIAFRINADITKKIQIWAGIKGVSAQYTSNLNISFLDPYLLVDAGLSVKAGIFDVYIKGENLTNTRYYQSEGYPNPGISVTAGASFKLN